MRREKLIHALKLSLSDTACTALKEVAELHGVTPTEMARIYVEDRLFGDIVKIRRVQGQQYRSARG